MESYRVGGVPGSGLQQGYMQHDRALRAQSNGNGTYGVSIRVQGIDGHPYVVLNNRDRDSQYGGPGDNGYMDQDMDESFIDHYHEYDFKGGIEPRLESPFVEYRSQKQMQFGSSHNGVMEFRESQRKSSTTLLNFQRHPELLKPYDPESNNLNLEGYHAPLPRPASFAETGTPYQCSLPRATLQQVSHARSSSLDKPSAPEPPMHLEGVQSLAQARPQAQPQVKPHSQAHPQALPQPQALSQKQAPSQHQVPSLQQAPPQSPAVPSTPSNPSRFTSRSPSTESSANSSLERNRREPDVLPLRRHDSSGPVLQTSASPSTSRTLPDEHQQEALYAETINRHQNRRYIPFMPGTGRDIDTGSIPGVDELIDKFDGKDSHQRRGRAGRRNRIDPEDRKRSRSVDSAFPFGMRGGTDYLIQFSKCQGRSIEHVLRPSQLRQHKGALSQDLGQRENPSSPASPVNSKFNSGGPLQYSSAPGSPQGTAFKGSTSVLGYRRGLSRSSTLPSEGKGEEEEEEEKSARSLKVFTSMTAATLSKSSSNSGKTPSSERDDQATPDILKGQEELSQQTNEETAKQILFNYLKDGSADNDDTTKKKVNLVFEKIQTLKSRAAGSVQGDSKPPDAAGEVKVLQEQRDELEKKVTELKNRLEEETKKQKALTEAGEKSGAELRDVQAELDKSREECTRLQEKLSKTEEELRATLEELFQVKMEREQYQTEIRDLQDQLSEMHDELDGAKRAESENREKEDILEDMMQLKLDFQEVLLEKEEQEEILRRRERELTALKGALKEEVATHDQEVDKLREQYEQEISKLQISVEEAKQSSVTACREKEQMETARGTAEGRAGRLTQESERLRRRVQELENEVAKLNRIIDEAKLQESRLADRLGRLEKEKRELEESLAEVREQEEELLRANRALTTRLEDVQRNLTKLNHDHKDLTERLREEKSQKEQFKKTKNEIEDERRLLDRTVEKLQKEMSEIVEASQTSTQELQLQIDEYKEKNRRELNELQRQLQDKGVELEKSRLAAKKLQEELSHLEDDLRQCKRERDEVLQRGKSLEQRVCDLEAELEAKSNAKDDRSRQLKLMEDRISQLEQDLDEERNSGDLLMDRIDRGREQVEQMRNELLQERAARQDLECDKIALERQNKDLKSRVAHLEGSQKSNKEGLVSQLESRIQELEERLEGEERDRANLQLMNRKLERKVKEMMMQVDDENHSLQDQKDQLNLRLKALKRQMDEAEEEIDRLEHSRKKLQRDLDEQLEINEQLQSQLKALRSEMRRKNAPAPLLSNLDDDDDDDISTDGEIYYSSSSGYKRPSQDPIL
ncbi:hypothetical protein AGOR_G00004780 [Albula goreensis]|uniref:Myosin tail domain-containing protein n=1 Tax=Albula goreensis TaxID=1534307 RepID=A0A8T3E5F6_9TELE|nr:hypothetical protein AGOR_G00004780 [Albula goreensis]